MSTSHARLDGVQAALWLGGIVLLVVTGVLALVADVDLDVLLGLVAFGIAALGAAARWP